MVEFLTGNLIGKVPRDILDQLDSLSSNNFTEFRHIFSHKEFTLDSFEELEDLSKVNNDDVRMPQRYTVNMNPKKTHEVAVMAKYVDGHLDKLQQRIIIDAGSGIGYFSAWMALNYNHKVLGIDSKERNSLGAETRSKKFIQKTKHFSCKTDNHKMITEFITETTDFHRLTSSIFLDSTNPALVLTGLHTCGSLSNNCMKIFKSVPEISQIFNVGCCYNLLSEEDFPMSAMVREELSYKLSRNARMLAAYSLDRVFDSQDLSNLIKIFYRALLEKLLLDQEPPIHITNIGPIKANSFSEYTFKVIQKCDAEQFRKWTMTQQQLDSYFASNEYLLRDLLIFHLFRMSFAPVIESIIVLDKALYLLESEDFNVEIVKLFDPVVSPRCYLIKANK